VYNGVKLKGENMSYQDRVKKERSDLRLKYQLLYSFIESNDEFKSLSSENKNLLIEQEGIMLELLNVLNKRIKLFK